MKKNRFFFIGIIALQSASAQNVGIGTTLPAAKLDVKSATSPYVAQFNGLAPMYMGIFEGDIYRGYLGSYSGNAEDVDFGTGGGTTGKLHLTIQASPRLTIDNTGKVGIGTTAPNYKLHVTGGDMFLQSSAGNFKIGYDGSNQWQYASLNGGADLLMQSSLNGTLFTPQHYFAQNGRVGLGTGSVTPAAPLEISTTSSETIRMKGANPYLSFYDNTDGYQGYLWYNGADMVLGSSTAPIRFASAGYRMAINTDGRVTIGSTNTPAAGYLLSVRGKAICEELKVQLSTAWPDYVFEDDYNLPSLETIEAKVMSEKHLPGIPSASDVQAQQGFELGDMQKRMLEKIEEMYRYMFQMNNENKSLKAEVSALKIQVQQIKK